MSTSWSAPLPLDVGVVLAAAGRGERCGDPPKQFRSLAGAPLLLHALRPFLSHPAVALVSVVLPEEQAAAPPDWLAELVGERLRVVAGGTTRMDSVAAGLRVLPVSCSIVLVHDGARPFPEAVVIDAVIAQARRGVGAIAAVPLYDTLKEAGPIESDTPPPVLRTLSRTAVWRAQTPQAFPRALLEAAYATARAEGFAATDDAELVERSGGTVVLVRDVSSNLKVTTPEDFRVAEALARIAR
ncbi:MAG TPA: 2-C-methyl-D-erythritol 4-phosphate cytidylyltransferase [Gemmatimonadales bacterium]|jgi:2-C-methyl-D-erythritol 4-phosphate cytidylyltransferase|nr:2-C-methyl-D-erythritol 4-phosphate cytidylyltransferase [Gemmatimonadales bacterium]